jgi:hypothetical protein
VTRRRFLRGFTQSLHSAIDTIRLDTWVDHLPDREVDIEFASRLRLGGRSGHMNFKVMAMPPADNEFGSLKLRAEVVDQLWMTDIDVQGRRTSGERAIAESVSKVSVSPSRSRCSAPRRAALLPHQYFEEPQPGQTRERRAFSTDSPMTVFLRRAQLGPLMGLPTALPVRARRARRSSRAVSQAGAPSHVPQPARPPTNARRD